MLLARGDRGYDSSRGFRTMNAFATIQDVCGGFRFVDVVFGLMGRANYIQGVFVVAGKKRKKTCLFRGSPTIVAREQWVVVDLVRTHRLCGAHGASRMCLVLLIAWTKQ